MENVESRQGHEKEFDAWNVQKKDINSKKSARSYRVRDIWWAALGVNVGIEQDGAGAERLRPVVVLKKISSQMCFIVPLTTSPNIHKYRMPIGYVGGKPASAITSQLRLIDAKRLIRGIERLDVTRFETIRKSVKDML